MMSLWLKKILIWEVDISHRAGIQMALHDVAAAGE